MSKTDGGNRGITEPLYSGGFEPHIELTEEQKSRFLKYRGLSLPRLTKADSEEILRLEAELEILKNKEIEIKDRIQAIKHKR